MREILFRGKRLINREWVEGLLGSKRTILVESPLGNIDEIRILPETVGQYTGLTDKNGKRIFEGDIVVIYSDEKNPVQIVFLESSWMAVMPKYSYYRHRLEDIKDKYEVIGNIHDNPELIDVVNRNVD